jgi:hypothetical protein
MSATYTGDSLLFDEELETDINFFAENLSGEYTELPEFLEFHSSFVKGGKQGVLGLLMDPETRKKYVYKISQYINHLVNHEYTILNGLNTIREFCPHYCKTLGKFRINVPDSYKKLDNPFEAEPKQTLIGTDVLLMENIGGSRKLYRYLKNDAVSPDIVMSLIKQTLLATVMASECVQFTHYDLHSNNILVRKCPVNSVFLYVLDENRTYLVPTYGYYPTIIDFGFSYIKNCESSPAYGPLAFTDIGHITTNYDRNADAKLFLTSVSYEMRKYKKSEESETFRQLIKNIYQNLNNWS